MSRRLFAVVFLALVALHCVAYEPGIEAELRIRGAPPSVAFLTEAGERVELDEALVHVDSVELLLCEPSLRAFGFRSVAHAHGLESGNGPWRIDLAVGGAMSEILRPAPGRYCAVVLHLDGRSFDAVAARFAGRMEDARMAEETSGPFDITLPLTEPLELDAPGDRPVLEVRFDQRKLFDHEGTLAERLEAIAELAVR